jgi:phytanoyl-CoA hydroxylase
MIGQSEVEQFVLFFNGQIVHRSLPNTSTTRFRRALIGHYVAGDAQRVASWFQPALRMDGSVVTLGTSEGGGECGVWVERDGHARVEMSLAGAVTGQTHE